VSSKPAPIFSGGAPAVAKGGPTGGAACGSANGGASAPRANGHAPPRRLRRLGGVSVAITRAGGRERDALGCARDASII
jgi:hypothetical protein